YVVAGGLRSLLSWLPRCRFTEDEVDWLAAHQDFPDSFLESLATFRFTGDVYAIPEGAVVFPGEPLVQVRAPIGQAQIIETAVLNLIHFQTLVLSKATRIVHAAQGRPVIEFGSRRAPGADAALNVARAACLAGFHSTSSVLAGKLWGVPIAGTMTHSFIQAHASEAEAFAAFAKVNSGTTLLVDTYDTLEGVRAVIALRDRLGPLFNVGAIRLDSGDLGSLAKSARQLLDRSGLTSMKILASSGLDEYRIAQLIAEDAPIDMFAVGTKLAVCSGASELDMAYKLVEYDGKPCYKLSPGKTVYPGPKQVFRESRGGKAIRDTIGRADEKLPGCPLLRPAILGGVVQPQPILEESRAWLRNQLTLLPAGYLSLDETEPYPVSFSPALQNDLEKLRR
ncbi:MAG: nicotinate phosphoribosyltransferase, partial [Acidobacteriota bacterium]|nr:nicotinate phosphoribosyltransferase [Acidobacteriota bacterium]